MHKYRQDSEVLLTADLIDVLHQLEKAYEKLYNLVNSLKEEGVDDYAR